MTQLDLNAMLQAARDAATAGSEILQGHFGALKGVRSKAPGDWVTAADLGSEAAVREVLTDRTGLPVHGEEEGGVRGDIEWLVDPLDGTANFVHGFDAVAVSIALVQDGTPVVGVVAAPFLSRTYWATEGGGAFRDGTPISVSARSPAESIVATGFPFRRKQAFDAYLPALTRVFHAFEDIRRVGAAALDLCWTAEGVFDGYFERSLGPWDVAAGGLIVREAGGVVTDWDSAGDDWLQSGDVVAGPPGVHSALLALITAP